MIKKIESSYITYLDEKNLYGWAMSLKLPVNGLCGIMNIYQNLPKTS